MSLVAELRRRNVFRVAAAYLVVGWLLTEVLTTILPTLGAPDWAARAVILVFAFGFLPTVILSWFYELTPEGIKREHEVVRDDSITRQTGRKLDYVTLTAIVVGIIFIAFFSARTADDDMDNPPPLVSEASIAVLPFVNMSDDKGNEYFSDGLTETLLHMLAQVPDLKVAARTSSFAFKGQNISIQEIAAALQVAHILEGSVQKVGDRVRITAQLIRASDGFHVWSSSYDRTVDDIFGIQDEIAVKVGSELSQSLLGETNGGVLAGIDTTDPDAYDLYLLARKERATFSYGGLQAAEDLLKGALLIDPDFLDAKNELAAVYVHQLETGLMNEADAHAEILALTEQVLAARPADVNARAQRTLSEAAVRARGGDFEAISAAVADLEALVAEAPNEFQPRLLLVRAYQLLQQFDNALPILEDALRSDPFNPQILYELGTLYMRLERWDEAGMTLERSLEIEPSQPNAYTNLAIISLQSGDAVGYVQQFLKAIEVDPKDQELTGMLAGFLYQLELTEEGDDLRERVVALAPTSSVAYRIDLLRAQSMGDEAAAIAAARRAIEDDVEDRRFAYGGAVRYLLRAAVRKGTVADALSYLDAHAPGLLDVDAAGAPAKYRTAQGVAFDAWFATLSEDEMLRRLDTLLEFGRSVGFDIQDDPQTHMNVLALRGEVQQAIDVALNEFFSQSVTMHLGWRRNFEQAQFADVVADSRVQAAMQLWEEEETALRGQVRSYLADLQAAS